NTRSAAHARSLWESGVARDRTKVRIYLISAEAAAGHRVTVAICGRAAAIRLAFSSCRLEGADCCLEKVNWRLEKVNWRLEKAQCRPEKPHCRSGREDRRNV